MIKVENLYVDNKRLALGDVDIKKPIFNIVTEKKEYTEQKVNKSIDIFKPLKDFKEKIEVGKFNIKSAQVNYNIEKNSGLEEHHTSPIDLSVEGLFVDSKNKIFRTDAFNFETSDLHFPVMNGFYTLSIGQMQLKKQSDNTDLIFDNIHLLAKYPKPEFAYKHPKHKDWFDFTVDNVSLLGIDIPKYYNDNVLLAKELRTNNAMLQNFKNQQIEIKHNIMPMIYEHIQQLPVKFKVDTANILNFSVVYEELAKKGITPGRLSFMNMNGYLSNLTNISSEYDQFIDLKADGTFMESGHFDAKWMIPVNKDYDRFLLAGSLRQFDLTELTPIVTHLAPVEIVSGTAHDVLFYFDATSLGGFVNMKFPYQNLHFNINGSDGNERKFITGLASRVIKSNNPDKKKNPIRDSHVYVERDPYHSTFNYFWQLLQPPLAESVGVSKKKQDFAQKVSNIMSGVKNFFHPKKKEKEATEK